jgi:hypothetical protein
MSRSRIPLAVLVVLLAGTLAAPSVWGAPRQMRVGAPSDLITRLWGTLTTLWTDAGCWLDPHGCMPTPDTGCKIDPHGVCLPSPDAGCVADPHGGCMSGS